MTFWLSSTDDLSFSSLYHHIMNHFFPISWIIDRNFKIIHMSFEETGTEDSASSLSKVSSLDDDFDTMQLEPESSDEETIDLMVHETNRYAEQYMQKHEISRRPKFHQWKPTTNE